MAIRWRKDGRMICSAISKPEEGDTYIDDRISDKLVELKVIVADPNHKTNGLWYWTQDALIVANPLWMELGSNGRFPSGLRSFILSTMPQGGKE